MEGEPRWESAENFNSYGQYHIDNCGPHWKTVATETAKDMSDPNFEQLLENSERLEVVPSETYGAISEAWHTLGEEEVKNWSPEFDEDGSEKTEKWNDQNDKRNMIITDGKTAVSIPLVKLKEMGWDFINGHLEGPSAQAKKKSIEWAYE